jgi:hypothetical protein
MDRVTCRERSMTASADSTPKRALPLPVRGVRYASSWPGMCSLRRSPSLVPAVLSAL